MRGDPAFRFAKLNQHTVYTFFRARTRIQVIGEQLIYIFQPVMYHHLFAGEVGVPKRGGQVDDRFGLKPLRNLAARNKPLQVRKPGCKKARVVRGNQQCRITQRITARQKRHHYEILIRQPIER